MMNTDELLNYIPDKNLLKGKVILVTGASSGIGRAVSLAYAKHGATVVLLSKTIKKLEAVYDEIKQLGYPEAAIYPMNLEGATSKDYHDLAQNIREQLGHLDGLLLNAGWVGTYTPFKHYEPSTWHKVMMVNLHANYLLTQACLPLLEQAADPAIVCSSHASGKAYEGAFGVAKSALDTMCRIIADEYSGETDFIRVNRIDSGPLRTSMRVMNYPGEDANTLAKPEAVVGPYLYYMGADAGRETNQCVRLGRLSADAEWSGDTL